VRWPTLAGCTLHSLCLSTLPASSSEEEWSPSTLPCPVIPHTDTLDKALAAKVLAHMPAGSSSRSPSSSPRCTSWQAAPSPLLLCVPQPPAPPLMQAPPSAQPNPKPKLKEAALDNRAGGGAHAMGSRLSTLATCHNDGFRVRTSLEARNQLNCPRLADTALKPSPSAQPLVGTTTAGAAAAARSHSFSSTARWRQILAETWMPG